jgi:sterol desaturase/sphingolipid hydroxylase (fatty acid hydroxylase superfamily)
MALPDPILLAIPAFVALLVVEWLWWRRRPAGAGFTRQDTAASLALGLGSFATGLATAGAVVAIAAFVHAHRLLDIPLTLWAGVLCFILDDFAYYLFHRSAHRVRWFWASHSVHHSSRFYNLSTALRQTWTGFISLSFLFRLPLFWIGFPVELVLFCGALNLVYQFWIHTEHVRRLPRWAEAVLNTPSHHRVHHAVNPRYLDRNYAGVFIVWDRLFGTFEPEQDSDPPRYGLVHDIGTHNPVKAAFYEWHAMARDAFAAKGPRDLLGRLFGPPGWATGDTADAMRRRHSGSE